MAQALAASHYRQRTPDQLSEDKILKRQRERLTSRDVVRLSFHTVFDCRTESDVLGIDAVVAIDVSDRTDPERLCVHNGVTLRNLRPDISAIRRELRVLEERTFVDWTPSRNPANRPGRIYEHRGMLNRDGMNDWKRVLLSAEITDCEECPA